ncbi:hypothetical protein [Thermotoga sp. KOL6]|uniref:hypothetical protein n=1 Tax=Thermotoga sp. KOL6 TaxID=126741 RepID=UPI000C77945D|nr:hypothetical protein [Thermotoga sp. KOL6]PLV59344.1 hypothetical protein AS005_06290 [Thermotoga sp. KOL6]
MRRRTLFFFIFLSSLLIASPLVTEFDGKLVYNCLNFGKPLPGILPIPSGEEKDEVSIEISPFFYFGSAGGKTKTGWFVLADPPWENFYLFERTPSFVKISLEGHVGKIFLYGEIPLRNNYNDFYLDFHSNIPPMWKEPYTNADTNFPYTAYLLYNDKDFYVVVGRSKVRWGGSDFPVSISDVSPCFNHFTFSTKGTIRYTLHVISINPVLTEEEWEKQSNYRPVNADPLSPYTEKVKTLAAHKVDLYPLESLRIGLGELTMIGGKYPDLFSLSPLAIWHNNYNEGYTNSMGVLDFSYVPAEGWELHGEFALDDLVGTTESDSKPTAYAFNVGLRKSFSFDSFKGVFGVEYAFSSKFVYNTFLPYLKFNNRFLYLTNLPPSRTVVDYPVGFAFGPDAHFLNFRLDLFYKDLQLTTNLFHLVKGPNTFYTEYPKEESGEVKERWGINVEGEYKGVVISFRVIDGELLVGAGFEWKF